MQRLYKRPDSPNWQCSIKDAQGNWVHRSTGKRDKKAAELVAIEYERAASDPTHAAAQKTTVASALEQLLKTRRNAGRAAATIECYAQKAGHFLRIWGDDFRLVQVDARAVDQYIDKRLGEGTHRSTIGKELTVLRGALKGAKRRGEFPGDIAAIMPEQWSTGAKPKERYLTVAEMQRLLPELLPDRGAHVAWIIATGARWSESKRARAADIDLVRGEVFLRGSKTDQSRRRIPVIDPGPELVEAGVIAPARALLQHALSIRSGITGPMFRPWGNVRHDLADACKRAGIARVTPNDLRRTMPMWLRKAGVEPHLIGAFLGHADSRMVERVYGRIPADALGEAIQRRIGAPGNTAGNASDPRDERVGDGGANLGRMGQTACSDPAVKTAHQVPRVGIEPTTRGFSVQKSRRTYRGGRPHTERKREAS